MKPPPLSEFTPGGSVFTNAKTVPPPGLTIKDHFGIYVERVQTFRGSRGAQISPSLARNIQVVALATPWISFKLLPFSPKSRELFVNTRFT